MERNDYDESVGETSGGAAQDLGGGYTAADSGAIDPDTGLEQEPALDPDPVDDADPETDGVG